MVKRRRKRGSWESEGDEGRRTSDSKDDCPDRQVRAITTVVVIM